MSLFTSRRALTGTLMAIGMMLGLPAAASADTTAQATECVGELGAIRVDGDVTVPRGAECDLNGTVVNGSVSVARNASLFTNGADIGGSGGDGNLSVARAGYAELFRTSVDGNVQLRGAETLIGTSTTFDGDIWSRRTGFVDLVDSSVDGNVDVRRFTGLFVEFANIDGRIIGRDVAYADVFDSSVDGRMNVQDADDGAFLCTTTVERNARFKEVGLIAQVGGDGTVGSGCGGSLIEGTLRITDTPADTEFIVTNNLIEGNLVCRFNDARPVGSGNFVEGQRRGQCQNMAAPGSSFGTNAAQDRRAERRAEMEARSARHQGS